MSIMSLRLTPTNRHKSVAHGSEDKESQTFHNVTTGLVNTGKYTGRRCLIRQMELQAPCFNV